MLVPLPNDCIKRLGTKTERVVRRGPIIFYFTSTSVIPSNIQN